MQSTPFAKLKMILWKLDNFHEPFSHNRSDGLWLSTTVLCKEWDVHFSIDSLPNSSVKNLPHHLYPIHHIIGSPHFMENLTHLSWVFDNAINSNASASIFKIALKLAQISNLFGLEVTLNYLCTFNTFKNVLELSLKLFLNSQNLEFTWHLLILIQTFSQLLQFLKLKVAQLVHLELGSPGTTTAQDRLGYDGGWGC